MSYDLNDWLDALAHWAERNLGRVLLTYGAAAWICMIIILVISFKNG